MLLRYVGCARKRIHHHPTRKQLKKCWINGHFLRKKCWSNIIQHSPQTHPTHPTSKRMNVLTLINVEKLLSRIAFVAGAIKIILINFITSENRERFSVDRDFSETLMQKN